MPLLARNVDLGKPLRLSSWRKIAIGTWRTAGDPSVYGTLEVDVGPALAYIEKVAAKTGLRVTLTHFIGKAFADTLARHPDINCIMRFGRIYPRKSIDIFFQVAGDGTGKDLSGTTIRHGETKSLGDFAREMAERIHKIRNEGDPEYRKTKQTMGWMPGFLAGAVLKVLGFVLYSLNLWSPILGSPRDPFGSMMITNIGSLGLDQAFAPLVPYSRIPLLIAVGAAKDTPVVRDGQVRVAKIVRLCATFDHRIIDGMHASHMCRTLLKFFEAPEREFGAP